MAIKIRIRKLGEINWRKVSEGKLQRFIVRGEQSSQSMFRAAAAPQDSLVNIQPEEEDDDLIYECPGLAPHGEMEVTNPFFLGQDFNMNCGEKKMTSCEDGDGPCLINTNNGIRPGNLVRNIKHGQQ